jgi:predicted nucleic acid-binding protein
MRIVVSDGACLTDLRKASLLNAFLKLPHEILIPNTLFEDGFLEFTSSQKKALIRAGLKIMDLPGESVLRAREAISNTPQLSIHHGLAFVLAQTHAGCILLTGDGSLRTLAASHRLKVRGVLWVVDEIHKSKLGTAASLHARLLLLADDPAVRLSSRELAASIKRYDGLR